jgi:hypothetical protein
MLPMPVMYNGVRVTVVTRPEADYKEKEPAVSTGAGRFFGKCGNPYYSLIGYL